MLIEIRNWYTDEVIFSLDTRENSIKRTVDEALKQGANLKDSNLRGADLSSANLSNVDLSGARLSGADLIGANLNYAYLRGADLSGARLSDADLRYANLGNVNLICANLKGANLRWANLNCTDLRGANLSGVDLRYANLCYAKNVPDLPMVCPKEGSFIAWKKIYDYKEDYKGEFIVKLEIPEDAKRSSATTNKCRCSKAKVLEIKNINTDKCIDVITNMNKRICVYKVGEYVYPDSFDENRWDECSKGIHFFMTEQEAHDY